MFDGLQTLLEFSQRGVLGTLLHTITCGLHQTKHVWSHRFSYSLFATKQNMSSVWSPMFQVGNFLLPHVVTPFFTFVLSLNASRPFGSVKTISMALRRRIGRMDKIYVRRIARCERFWKSDDQKVSCHRYAIDSIYSMSNLLLLLSLSDLWCAEAKEWTTSKPSKQ